MSEESYSQETPWLGPESFTEAEADRFFGRNAAKTVLVEMVEDGLLTVLFGDSGLGKTSLIRAGLFPELRKRFYTPIYFRLRFEEEGPTLTEQVWRKVYALAGFDWQVDGYPASFWEWFHDREQGLLGERLAGVSLVLVFDQFEEVFTKGLGPRLGDGSNAFLRQLADLVENRIPGDLNRTLKSSSRKKADVERRRELSRRYLGPRDSSLPPYRVVLSLRADYLYLFDRLTGMMPSAMKRRMELTPMTKPDALEAIRSPAKHLIDPDVAQELVERLDPDEPGEKEFSLDGETVESVRIQPGVLSLVCHRLNRERIQNREQEITLQRLGEKFDSIFEDYYEEAVKDLSPAAREYLEETLIGPFGHRTHIPRSAIEEAVGTDAVESLMNCHLVQGDERGGTKYVEFVHDRFAAVARARRDARRDDAEKAARLAREEEEARNVLVAAEMEARHEAEKAAASKRMRKEHEAELARVGEALSDANEKLESREKAFERFQKRTRRAKVVMIVWLVISLICSVALVGATLWTRSNLRAQVAGLEQTVQEKEKLARDATEELNKKRDEYLRVVAANQEELLTVQSQLNRYKTAELERDQLLVDNEQLKTRIEELDAKSRLIVVRAEPVEIVPPADVVPDLDPIEMEVAAMTLVEAFLRAGSGKEAKEQWEYFADQADYLDLPPASSREIIRDGILKGRAEISQRSFWLMAPPKLEARDDNIFTLVALYASRSVKDGKPSWEASESRFKVAMGSSSEGSLISFVQIRNTHSRSLSELDQFQFVYDRWSELSFSKRFPVAVRDRWLALMTHQLYVMAGKSYDGLPSMAISPEAGLKIQNQAEFFADPVDHLEDKVVSRSEAARRAADYNREWPKRNLTTIFEPQIGNPDENGLIEVSSQLQSRTENTKFTDERVVNSRMKIRIDPSQGPEIVWIRGDPEPGSIKVTPNAVPKVEKPKPGFFERLRKKDR